MEEKIKYYTPTIEEFHVGFEFEFFEESGKLIKDHPANKSEWKSEICDWQWLDIICDNYEHNAESISELYRVKFLDKEDIESLGWNHTGRAADEWFEIEGRFEMGSWTSRKATMHYGLYDYRLYIQMWDTGVLGPNVFQGIIKNRTELKKLMQQLNIIK